MEDATASVEPTVEDAVGTTPDEVTPIEPTGGRAGLIGHPNGTEGALDLNPDPGARPVRG